MAGGVDEIDQETVIFLLLSVNIVDFDLGLSLDERKILLFEIEEQRDGAEKILRNNGQHLFTTKKVTFKAL